MYGTILAAVIGGSYVQPGRQQRSLDRGDGAVSGKPATKAVGRGCPIAAPGGTMAAMIGRLASPGPRVLALGATKLDREDIYADPCTQVDPGCTDLADLSW